MQIKKTEGYSDMLQNFVSVITALSALVAIMCALRNNKKTDEKEIEKRVAQRVETNMKLDSIQQTVSDIKDALFETKKDVQNLGERLRIVEGKADRAHVRIDAIEGKHYENGST